MEHSHSVSPDARSNHLLPPPLCQGRSRLQERQYVAMVDASNAGELTVRPNEPTDEKRETESCCQTYKDRLRVLPNSRRIDGVEHCRRNHA